MKKVDSTSLYMSALLYTSLLALLAICCAKIPDTEEPPLNYPTRYTTIEFKSAATGLPMAGVDVRFWLELNGSGAYSFVFARQTPSHGRLVLQWSGTGKNETSYRLYTQGKLSLPDTFQLSKPISDTIVTIFLEKISKNLLGFNGEQYTTGNAQIINGQLNISGFILADSVAVGVYPLGAGQYNALWGSNYNDCVHPYSFFYCNSDPFYSGFAHQSSTGGKIEITRINWQDSVVWGRFEGEIGLQTDGAQYHTYQNGSFDSLSFRFVSGKAGTLRPSFGFLDGQNRSVKHRNITAVRNDTAFIVTMANYADAFRFTLPIDIQPGTYTAAQLAVSTAPTLTLGGVKNVFNLSFYLDPSDTIQITEVDMINHRIKGIVNLDLWWGNTYIFKNGSFQVNWE